jgi:hypothetical protein
MARNSQQLEQRATAVEPVETHPARSYAETGQDQFPD